MVVIHGGFWQSTYGLDLGAPTSADLARRGWAAWNIEYRRLGDSGGWPTTFGDVAAAVDHLHRLDGVDPAAWSRWGTPPAASSPRGPPPAAAGAARRRPAGPVSAAVPQAGVLDLRPPAPGLGGTAVPGMVGGMPDRVAPAATRWPTPSSGCRSGCRSGACTASTTPVPMSQSRCTSTRPARPATTPGWSGSPATIRPDRPGTPAWRRTVEVLGRPLTRTGPAAPVRPLRSDRDSPPLTVRTITPEQHLDFLALDAAGGAASFLQTPAWGAVKSEWRASRSAGSPRWPARRRRAGALPAAAQGQPLPRLPAGGPGARLGRGGPAGLAGPDGRHLRSPGRSGCGWARRW